MSDVEALMWNLEKDPALASTFANVTILDQAPDADRLRDTMEHAVRIVPRLRQRVVPAFGRLAPPEWQDDAEFDLDYHIRRIGVPAPADDRALFDLAATLAAQPLERTRPLWEFTIVDGLDGGRAALFQKLHHTITDGEGGVRMSAEFIDFMTQEAFAIQLVAGGDLSPLDMGDRAPRMPSRLAGEIFAAWQSVLANGTLLPYLEFSAPNGAEVLYPTMQSILAGHETPERGLALIEQSRQKFLDSL